MLIDSSLTLISPKSVRCVKVFENSEGHEELKQQKLFFQEVNIAPKQNYTISDIVKETI